MIKLYKYVSKFLNNTFFLNKEVLRQTSFKYIPCLPSLPGLHILLGFGLTGFRLWGSVSDSLLKFHQGLVILLLMVLLLFVARQTEKQS
jgi:hypothetical protein